MKNILFIKCFNLFVFHLLYFDSLMVFALLCLIFLAIGLLPELPLLECSHGDDDLPGVLSVLDDLLW